MIVIHLAKALWLRRAGRAQGTRAIRAQTLARPWLEIDLPIMCPGIGTTSGARLQWMDPKSAPMVEVDRGPRRRFRKE